MSNSCLTLLLELCSPSKMVVAVTGILVIRLQGQVVCTNLNNCSDCGVMDMLVIMNNIDKK